MSFESSGSGDMTPEEIRAFVDRELGNLSAEQKALYINLQQTPYERQTSEMKEMVERLALIGCGYDERQADYFLKIKATPVEERTPGERDLVMRVLAEKILPETMDFDEILRKPVLHAKLTEFANELMIFPSRMHEKEYAKRIEALQEELNFLMSRELDGGEEEW